MTNREKREQVVLLRKQGMSYSQIKERLGVSKSTLSGWLKEMPLKKERIRELRANSSKRIERYRETMRKKKNARRMEAFNRVAKDVETSSDKNFLAGFYLYWGEGTKTAEYTVSLTNSDPSMMRCFVEWLKILGVSSGDMRVKLHLYSDQEETQLLKFWSKALNIPIKNFNKSYIKDSRSDRKTYKGMFPYGTCVVAYHDRDMREYVMAGIQYLQRQYAFAVK